MDDAPNTEINDTGLLSKLASSRKVEVLAPIFISIVCAIVSIVSVIVSIATYFKPEAPAVTMGISIVSESLVSIEGKPIVYNSLEPHIQDENLPLDTINADDRLRLGERLYFNGQYGKSAQALEEFVKTNQDNYYAFQLLGKSFYYDNKKQLAQDALNKSIELKETGDSYLYLGLVRLIAYNESSLNIALDNFDSAEFFEGDMIKILNGKGQSYHYLGRDDDAIRNYARAIELDSRYHHTYLNLAKLYLDASDTVTALGYYQTAFELQPHDPISPFYMGKCYYEQGDYDKAVNWFQQACSLKDNVPDFFIWSGKAHYEREQFDQALAYLNKAIELIGEEISEETYDLYALRGIQYHNLGYYYNSLYDLKAALQFTQNREYREYYASALYFTGDPSAESELEALVEKGASYYCHYLLGRTYEDKRNFEGAIDQYELVIQLTQGYLDAEQRLERIKAN